MNNMHNQPFDPYYMGVDPTMYGAAGNMQMTPVMPYPGTPMLPGPVTRGPVAPASHTYNLNDPYNRFPPPSMPFFASNSPYTSSVGMHDYEEEGEGSGMHQSTPSLGGPSQPMGHSASRSQSEDGEKSDDKTDGEAGQGDDSPKKKPRVTLARGGACVNCRNRKLKCTGERPCKSCKKGSIECRYEELTRRRPRAVLMEERVVELEQLLFRSGIPVPPSPLNPPGANISPQALLTPQYSPAGTSFGDRPASSHSSSQTSFTLPVPMSVGTNLTINITPNSALELSLINVVLPYTPFISIPLHAPRFLSLLSLPAGHPSRPHPALLYILFAEAVRIIEGNVPLPQPRSLPPGLCGLAQTPVIACAHVDRTQLLNQFHGTSLSLLERAQHELNEGIRNVDRPFDLVRAALGISRYLYTLGRFIEGWNIPVARLAITCGLHRLTGTIVSPDASTATLVAHPILDAAPLPYGTTEYYSQRQRILSSSQPSQRVLRKKPVILPPARDAIDVAERNATWWAVKGMDWSASVGWGWVGALSDADCTSELPWGWGIPVEKFQAAGTGRYSISDLIDTSSALHTRTLPESTYALSIASLCLLQKASSLFDRPSKGETPFSPVSAEFASECANLEQAVANLRKRIPAPFKYPSQTMALPGNPHDLGSPIYDGNSDPWWIQLHVSLFTSEMLLLSEMSSHRAGSYEKAVASARSVVSLVRQIRPDQWAHIEMITVICLSLVSRFLNNESARLAAIGQQTPAGLAADDAETLRVTLERDISPWLQMAGLHALIITRVKKGWAEKEGEYERV